MGGECLKSTSTLMELRLANNTIAEALTMNSTPKTLVIRDNKIGDVGGRALAEALKTNSTLQALAATWRSWPPSHRVTPQRGQRMRRTLPKMRRSPHNRMKYISASAFGRLHAFA